MAYDRFLIAPFDENSGLTTNARPWQIPDNSWATMQNANVFRGRIRKRFGSRYIGSGSNVTITGPLTSRLRIQVGTIGAPTSPVPGNVFQPGQMFSAGSQLFTVTITGTPAAMQATGPGTGTFNTTTGAFALAATGLAGGTPIYFYPAMPVMGLWQYEFTAINNFTSFGFDIQFAYIFTNNAWQLSNNSPTWNGNDTNFFWAYNWVGPNSGATGLIRALFVSNFQVTNPNGVGTATDDPIYYWNGTTWTSYLAYLNPGAANAPATGPFVQTALIIVPFHGSLILLNTIENDGTSSYGNNIQYVNRARWSTIGSPFAVNAWYPIGAADNAGNIGIAAGFADASTLEAIVSAEFIKDRLIVYFEESTWELVYNGNYQAPFEWQKLNTELGSMATFSTIAFDKAILTVGEVGIHSCNGSNVTRIDQKIPDQVFSISNPAAETQRICGIRDYYNEMVYWSFPQQNQISAQPYPSQVLVYNYQNQTWSFNDDTITAFGYFDGTPALQWQNLQGTWEEWTSPWNSGDIAQQTRQIIGGNQQGFTFAIDTESENATRGAGVLQITTMTAVANGIQMTIYNHMFGVDDNNGDYIYVENAEGTGGFALNGFRIYSVIYVDQNTIIATYPESVYETYGYTPTFTGTYKGGGTAARVSNYNLYSKQWNPYDKDGTNVYIAKIDFAVIATPVAIYDTPNGMITTGGQFMVNYSPSSTPLDSIAAGMASNALMGTGTLETTPYALYPLEAFQNRLWHPVYLQTEGECVQINIYLSPLQICTPAIAFADFQIEGLVLYSKKTSDRFQ